LANNPTHIIESDGYGYNSGRFRLAFGDENVKRILRGLVTRYPDANITVLSLAQLEDVTSSFVVKESEDVAPF
jgi:hypothetical protein